MNTDDIRNLYFTMLDAWNRRSAGEFAYLFTEDGTTIGFDGSLANSRAQIESHLSAIFTDHITATYVAQVRDVRFLTPDVAVLKAVSALVPPGKSDINPATNAIQTLVAVHQNNQWRIASFQNTPAAFHGRPELSAALTEELRALLP